MISVNRLYEVAKNYLSIKYKSLGIKIDKVLHARGILITTKVRDDKFIVAFECETNPFKNNKKCVSIYYNHRIFMVELHYFFKCLDILMLNTSFDKKSNMLIKLGVMVFYFNNRGELNSFESFLSARKSVMSIYRPGNKMCSLTIYSKNNEESKTEIKLLFRFGSRYSFGTCKSAIYTLKSSINML